MTEQTESIRELLIRRMLQTIGTSLNRFDEETGRFLSPGGGWTVTNQDIIWVLAQLYTCDHPDNPYHGDEQTLHLISCGGDALRDWQNPDGTVEFIKADGSRWGPTFMCWSMYHWLETYAHVRNLLDGKRASRWGKGLLLAYTGIADLLRNEWRVHNIPCWQAMALGRAGRVFNRPDWSDLGRKGILEVVTMQDPRGYWREHTGPTVGYNSVYVHAIGLYHGITGDNSVLDSLGRALDFQILFSYPDGSRVETIDGRQPYHAGVNEMGIAGYVHFPRGRRFARFLMINALRGDVGARWPALLASALHYSPEDTSEEDIFLQQTSYRRELAGIAVCRRQDPWFACLGNYTAPSVDNRWGTDRQSFVSLWHRRSGLIIGGGNSRNQPEAGNLCWDRDDRTLYVPDAIEAVPGDDSDAVILSLGAHRVEFRARSGDDRSTVTIRLLSDAPADGLRAGLPLRIVPGSPLKVDGNDYLPPEAGLRAQAHGSMTVAHGAWRIRVPDGCTVVYPVKPFNPYHPDGDAPPEDFRAAIVLPLTGVREYEVGIEVP